MPEVVAQRPPIRVGEKLYQAWKGVLTEQAKEVLLEMDPQGFGSAFERGLIERLQRETSAANARVRAESQQSLITIASGKEPELSVIREAPQLTGRSESLALAESIRQFDQARKQGGVIGDTSIEPSGPSLGSSVSMTNLITGERRLLKAGEPGITFELPPIRPRIFNAWLGAQTPAQLQEFYTRSIDQFPEEVKPFVAELIRLNPRRMEEEQARVAAAGGGGPPNEPREPGRRDPEGPRGPENLENLWGPEIEERGRWLVEQILEMRTTMTYEERYRGENGIRLRGLYDSLQDCVNALIVIRNDPDPYGPQKHFPTPTRVETPDGLISTTLPQFPDLPQEIEQARQAAIRFREQYQMEGLEEGEGTRPAQSFDTEPLPDPNHSNLSINARATRYNECISPRVNTSAWRAVNPDWRNEFIEAQRGLQNYFKHAKNQGLLKEVDWVLNNMYQQIASGRVAPADVRRYLNEENARAGLAGETVFIERSLRDPNVPAQLDGVWGPYIDWARRRIEMSLNGQSLPDAREGEWSFASPEGAGATKQTYWEVGSYPKLYVITAETPEQFIIAKESFLKMVRSGALGRAPTANFEHVKNFIEEFSRAAGRHGIEAAFLEENRVELEGLLFLRVSSYSKEVYDPKQSKEASMAMAKDEGPQRWVAVYRSGRGSVAALTQMFDYEAIMDIFNNPVGEQGELTIAAGHFLQDTIQTMAIERAMGIALKDYDPRDPYFNSDDLGARIKAAVDLERIKAQTGQLTERDQARLNAFKSNLLRLGLTKSREEFKSLYEGFDKGDTHIKNFLRYVEDQNKPNDQRIYPPAKQLPESIRRSIDLGRVQAQLGRFRQGIIAGEIKLEEGQKAIDLLSPKDRQIYQAAFDEATANFEVAFEMQGVLGEKARRGRGFLYVDRNPHIQCYYRLGEGFRMQWTDAAKTQVINTDMFFTTGRNDFTLGYTVKVKGEHERADREETRIFDMRTIPTAEHRSFRVGWMLYKMRDGKRLDSFPREWQRLYEGLTAKEKEDVVDNIPTYQLENVVQWVVSWTKMKYANRSAKVRRQKVREARERMINEVKTNGYSAQFWDDEPGPNRRPQLMRYKRPLGVIDQATGQFRKLRDGEVLGYGRTGREVRLRFGDDGKPRGIDFDEDGRVIVFDKADPRERQRVSYDCMNQNTIARLVRDTEVGDTLVEEVVPTFEFAAQSSDFRNRYTVDTYLFYQGNNRVTKFTPAVIAARDRVAEGLSRPEDEDELAIQALLVDLTRRRTKKLPDVQQAREVTLMAAGVLESFQDRMRIRHGLYKAFLPKDGYVARMRAGYRNEDWAGMDRLTFGLVEFASQQPLRIARRMAAQLAIAPLEHDSGPARWGAHGVSGGVKLMADHIQNITHQRLMSQFGETKIFELLDLAVTMYNYLVGYTDPQTGKHVFGLLEKPTDNFEALHQFVEDLANNELLHKPKKAIPFLYKNRESYGRLRTVTQHMRVMYSNNDNSAGCLNLEDHEVFLEDGSFNTAIEFDRTILGRNGIARNRQYAFLYGEEGWDDGQEGYYGWLQDESPGGGSDIYRREKYWASLMDEEFGVFTGRVSTVDGVEVPEYEHGGKVKNWETDKDI